MQKLQLSGIYGEFGGNISIGYDMASRRDLTAFIELTRADTTNFYRQQLDMIKTETPDYYPTGLTILPQAGSQLASAFPEPSAWREFIETKGLVDDGVSWLFRKSLVSMAITQVLKS